MKQVRGGLFEMAPKCCEHMNSCTKEDRNSPVGNWRWGKNVANTKRPNRAGPKSARSANIPRSSFLASSPRQLRQHRMPKHVPTFKHLLTSTQAPQQSEHREKSVNDLIASSRVHKPVQRDLPPHITRGERVWAPSTTVGGLVDVEDGGIHPYEIARIIIFFR